MCLRPVLVDGWSTDTSPVRVTSQRSAHGRFTRAVQRRNLFQADLALREMGTPSLLLALDYLELLADVRPDKFDRAAVRWHGRLELESAVPTLAESQLAPAALGALRSGHRDAVGVLSKLLRKPWRGTYRSA